MAQLPLAVSLLPHDARAGSCSVLQALMTASNRVGDVDLDLVEVLMCRVIDSGIGDGIGV